MGLSYAFHQCMLVPGNSVSVELTPVTLIGIITRVTITWNLSVVHHIPWAKALVFCLWLFEEVIKFVIFVTW